MEKYELNIYKDMDYADDIEYSNTFTDLKMAMNEYKKEIKEVNGKNYNIFWKIH